MKLERQAQHEAKAERQRLRAERAETRRAKRKRHHRRQQLRGVHPQDYDQIEVVDDALDFELEAEEALEGDTEIPEAELQPLLSDPIDRVLLLELTPTQQQHTELLRREYMKACSDYHARLSRYLPEYVEAFTLSSWDPASFAADTQGRLTDYAGALNRVGNGTPLDDRALDCDLQLRPFGLSRYSAPASSLPVPPSQERFWLTEAELSEPELRAQRAMEVQPHIDHHVQVVVKHQEEVAAARAAFNAERDARAAAAGFCTYLQMDNAILKREHPGLTLGHSCHHLKCPIKSHQAHVRVHALYVNRVRKQKSDLIKNGKREREQRMSMHGCWAFGGEAVKHMRSRIR